MIKLSPVRRSFLLLFALTLQIGRFPSLAVSPEARETAQLIAHWTFDDGATDVTGNGHDGEIHGAVAAEGRVAGSLAFDGFDDYVSIPNTPLLGTVTAGPHSIAAWVFIDQDTQDLFKFIVDAAEEATLSNEGDQRGLRLFEGLVVFKWVTTTQSHHAFSDAPLPPGEWHHLVGTFDGAQGALYIDGVLQEEIASSGTPTRASLWNIGFISAGGTGTGQFDGRIDDVRVYRGALTPQDVIELYQSADAFDVCPAFDESKAWPGAVVPVRLRLCTADGTNVSSADIAVRAVGLTRDGSEVPFTDVGNTNPENYFRFSDDLYILNLSTENLSPGIYELHFVADGDPTMHSVSIRIR